MSKSNSVLMWMLKDKKGVLYPGYGVEFTRKQLKEKVSARTNEPFETWQKYGWRAVKVRITEVKEGLTK